MMGSRALRRRRILAVERSIRHWREIQLLDPKEMRAGQQPVGINCACCLAFHCVDCPVYEHNPNPDERTDAQGCRGTPYTDAIKAYAARRNQVEFAERQMVERARRAWSTAAGREVRFLENVLAAEQAALEAEKGSTSASESS